MISIWILLTGENCNIFIYEGIQQKGYLTLFYYISNTTIGNVILMNLYMALFINLISQSIDDENSNENVENNSPNSKSFK